jgi:hypothetical protein
MYVCDLPVDTMAGPLRAAHLRNTPNGFTFIRFLSAAATSFTCCTGRHCKQQRHTSEIQTYVFVSWLMERRTDRASHRAYCTSALPTGASENKTTLPTECNVTQYDAGFTNTIFIFRMSRGFTAHPIRTTHGIYYIYIYICVCVCVCVYITFPPTCTGVELHHRGATPTNCSTYLQAGPYIPNFTQIGQKYLQ